jgi:hypothetical protein
MRARLIGSLGAAIACGALTACGSGIGGGTSTTGANHNAGLAFSKCMRAHGLSEFPDPGGSSGSAGSGAQVSILGVHVPSTINIHAPAFRSAMKLCIKQATGGQPPRATAAQRRAALDFSRCMRRHGVPDYPDPVFKNGGIGEAPPPSMSPTAPALLRAQKLCGNP